MKNNKKTSKTEFENEHPYKYRRELSDRLRKRYPDRVPVIISMNDKTHTTSDTPKRTKFLVPEDWSMGGLIMEIRKSHKIAPEEALFFFLNKGVLAPMSLNMGSLYQKFGADDGFLYFKVAEEATFG